MLTLAELTAPKDSLTVDDKVRLLVAADATTFGFAGAGLSEFFFLNFYKCFFFVF